MSVTDLSEKESEDLQVDEGRTLKTILRKEWQMLTKILELVFCVLTIALVMIPAKRSDLPTAHLDHFALIFTTLIGYTLINSVFIISRIIGDRMPYRVGFIYSLLATGLFIASGILLATDRKRVYFYDPYTFEPKPYLLNLVVASSAFAFLSSIIFAFEAVYIWKFREDF